MKALFIKDDAAARAMAEAHGLADDMITRAKVREARAIVAQVGLVTASRTGYMLPNGRLEIITCCLFTNFVEGENGWSVWGWTDIRFDFEDPPRSLINSNEPRSSCPRRWARPRPASGSAKPLAIRITYERGNQPGVL